MDPDMEGENSQKAFLFFQNNAAIQLAHRVASSSGKRSNIALSRPSIHAALYLLAGGSDVDTVDKIDKALGDSAYLERIFNGDAFLIVAESSARVARRICFSHAVWVDASLSLNENFRRIAASHTAEVKAADFQTEVNRAQRLVISSAENTTTGLIRELLPAGSVNQNSRLVLDNAIYFKEDWKEAFHESHIEESEFLLLDGSTVLVPFMSCKKKRAIFIYVGFKVLKIPYNSKQFSMYIFLPDARDGLFNLYEKLTSDTYLVQRDCSMGMTKVDGFKIPKFKISFGFEASQALKFFGLTLPFTGCGDLKRMVDSPEGDSLFVSLIFHISEVEFSKEGTEAAATTFVVVDDDKEGNEAPTTSAAVAMEVNKEGTVVAAVTASSVTEVEEGTEKANATAAVSFEYDEEETEATTVTLMEDDKEGSEATTVNSSDWMEDDEGGSEAATVNSSDWMEDEDEETSELKIFKADRPFAFVIREDKTGLVLFVGYLLNPLATAS